MMARRKKIDDADRMMNSGRSFEELMRSIPVEQFIRMVAKSGLPTQEAREICNAFKEMKT